MSTAASLDDLSKLSVDELLEVLTDSSIADDEPFDPECTTRLRLIAF